MRRGALLLVFALAACGAPAANDAAPDVGPAAAVLTEGAVPALPDPAARYPDGAQVVRVEADGARTVLSEGLAAAGGPAVHHDGARVLFVGREKAGDVFRVYECAADGGDRRIVVDHGTDCIRAAYLPDGRIVYAAELPGLAPLAGVERPAALFVAAGDGKPGERISFGAGLDTDPTVLSDGRVLFASWRPDDAGGGRLGLFTVHPDGTGYAPFHLASTSISYPVQEDGLDVRFRVHDTDSPARESVAAWDAPLSVSAVADEMRGEQVSLRARRRPQGHLSSMKADRPYGTLVCVDARSSGATSATRVRVTTFGGERTVLGDAPLAEDGSFMLRVPPDTPLLMHLLDADGTPVRSEHGPFWVRNNEARVCVSCHDDVETAPPNKRPMAVLGEPVDMTEATR